jgi:uncharacterized membrane protein
LRTKYLEVQLPGLGQHLRAHPVVRRGQQADAHAERGRDVGGGIGQCQALRQQAVATHVERQVGVADAEPRLLAEPLEHPHGRERVAGHAPALGGVHQAGERVEHGVDVRADEQTVALGVIRDVDDHAQGGRVVQRLREAMRQLRSPGTARQQHDLHCPAERSGWIGRGLATGAVMTRTDTASRHASVLPAILLGIGLGGFFDGIVLHQVLQWHHLLSAHVPPDSVANLELNTLADGLFHAAAWVVTVVGVFLLWGETRRGGWLGWSRLIGGLLAGWGGFNLAEGIVDHQILGLHHVRPGSDQLAYDLGFLAWGAAMLVAGVLLLRVSEGQRRADA